MSKADPPTSLTLAACNARADMKQSQIFVPASSENREGALRQVELGLALVIPWGASRHNLSPSNEFAIWEERPVRCPYTCMSCRALHHPFREVSRCGQLVPSFAFDYKRSRQHPSVAQTNRNRALEQPLALDSLTAPQKQRKGQSTVRLPWTALSWVSHSTLLLAQALGWHGR